MRAAIAIESDLEFIVEGVSILSPSRYEILGLSRRLVPLSEEPVAQVPKDPRAPAPTLVDSVAEDLYRLLFCREDPRPIRRVMEYSRQEHQERLSAANAGAGAWRPGFRLLDVGGEGEATVEKDGVTYWLAAEDLRPDGGELVRGAPCRVLVPKEASELMGGYYVAFGDADEVAPDAREIVVRLYWHLRADSAVEWVGLVTERLNRRAVPFHLKLPSSPRDYCRADAGVLYLSPEAYAEGRDAIHRVYGEVAGKLRPRVPRLTLRLAAGLGLAEGSGDGASFGMARCQLISAALVESFERGQHTLAQRRAAVVTAFEDAGLDPARPHLAAGSDRSYAAPGASRVGSVSPARTERPVAAGADPATFRESAIALGESLCDSANWDGRRCNWTGHSSVADPTTIRGRRLVLTALGADLYEGTAGVGLFLAELSASSGEDSHRRTALGALRHALSVLEAEPGGYPSLGFYSGQLGIAWAARRVAQVTSSPKLAEIAAGLLARLLYDIRGEHFLDLIHGNAGAIMALLSLYRDTGESRFLEAAITLGVELCVSANRDGDAWSWDNERAFGSSVEAPPLTGFSHGAAGIGLALLELHSTTRRSEFLQAGRGAFYYEDSVFDAARGNWPDYRGERPLEEDTEPRFETAWCHGAPGIALSRLRAMTIDPEGTSLYETAARVGLATTLRKVREWMRGGPGDASLCHGLCGSVEIIRSADFLSQGRSLAEGAMKELVDRHAERGDWPSGVLWRRRNPSLFVGEAGIGYTLLRFDDPARVPSVLGPGL